MQDLEYLIQILKFCEKELTKGANQSSTRGCGGCNPLECIDCYALKCTKHHYLQELVCSNVFL